MGFAGKCLHRGNGVQYLSGHGAGIGDLILAGARHLSHTPAQRPERQDNHGKQNNHHTCEPSTGHQHHGHAANQHHQAAECNGYARTDQGLH